MITLTLWGALPKIFCGKWMLIQTDEKMCGKIRAWAENASKQSANQESKKHRRPVNIELSSKQLTVEKFDGFYFGVFALISERFNFVSW